MSRISREILHMEYVTNEKTDSMIAEQYGLTKSAVSAMRRRYGIPTRNYTGYRGESFAIQKLIAEGFEVEDMNKQSMNYPYDLRVSNNIRVDVKSAKLLNGTYTYVFTERKDNGNIESETRIRFDSGRTRKKYEKTCDFLLLVGIDDETLECQYFVVPTNAIPNTLQTLSIPASLNSKYAIYHDRWDLLMNEPRELNVTIRTNEDVSEDTIQDICEMYNCSEDQAKDIVNKCSPFEAADVALDITLRN